MGADRMKPRMPPDLFPGHLCPLDARQAVFTTGRGVLVVCMRCGESAPANAEIAFQDPGFPEAPDTEIQPEGF